MTAHWSASTASWSQTTALSGVPGGMSGEQLAASPSGAAAAAWTNGAGGIVDGQYRADAGSPWQAAAVLLSSRYWAVGDPQVAVDDHGDAYALWSTHNGIDLDEHMAGAAAWSPPAAVVNDARVGSLAFAATPDGTLAVVWEHVLAEGVDGQSRSLLYVKVKPSGRGAWQRARVLGAEGGPMLQGDTTIFVPGPRIAVDAAGRLFVVWQWPHRGDFYPRIAVLTANTRWRTARVTSLPEPGLYPVIAGDDRGLATVVWGGRDGWVEAAEISPRGRILGVRRLGTGGGQPAIAGDARGDVVAVWTSPDPAIAFRRAGRGWCTPVRLLGSTEAQAAISPDGRAMVVWHRGSDTQRNTELLARTLTSCRG